MTPSHEVFIFGVFRLDATALTLERDGARVALNRQSLEVLAHLIAHRERVVTRGELIEAFWTRTPTGADDRLNTCIRRIRSALDEENDGSSAIETQPRVGYRFKSAVRVEVSRRADTSPPTRRRGLFASVAAAAAGLCLVAAPAVFIGTSSARDPDSTYKNDGYTLEKYGDLQSDCDFQAEGGPGECVISGRGSVRFLFGGREVLTAEVRDGRDLRCVLQDGTVECR